MKITLRDEAIHWFENKYPLHEGEAIRFFGKTYGETEVHEGFSLGIQADKIENYNEDEIIALAEENGRKYFTTKEDDWFFKGYDLEIGIDDNYNEPSYHFISQDPDNESEKVDATSSATKK